MKFDYIIGNPPYQEEQIGDNEGFSPPVYNKFLDSAFNLSEKVVMIHPARFLFRAGSTPKAWNEKMLADVHFKILSYVEDARTFFPNTDIKGGVAISYHDNLATFMPIEIFSKYKELTSIRKKVVEKDDFVPVSSIMENQTRFDLEALYSDYPEYKSIIGSNGKDKRFRNNIFDKVSLFTDVKSDGDINVLGVEKNKRVVKFIPSKYVQIPDSNIPFWKVAVVRVNGTGAFGEVLSTPVILAPNEGYTQTFIGVGHFANQLEAENALKYIKTKFARAMLSVLKITQDNSIDTWSFVPLQKFSTEADLNWSKSIAEIDQQLYEKYKLTQEEIDFIEKHVKEME